MVAGMASFKVMRLHSEMGRRVSRFEEARLDDLDAGDVVIRWQYAAVNYKDARAVTGEGNVVKRFPCIVAASNSTKFREGDVVTVQGGAEFGIGHDGAYAEYARVPAEWVYRVTGDFDSFSVVALGIAAYTAALCNSK
jgi:alcohol dehydrogenase